MNPVLYWNSVLLEASRRDFTRGFNNAQQPGPIRTARAMAIVHLAIRDAVAFNTDPATAYLKAKAPGHGVPPLTGDVDDIIAGAAVTTLKHLYPKFATYIDDALGPVDQVQFDKGELVGNAMLEHRGHDLTAMPPADAMDGSDTMINGPQPASPAYGEHRADPYAPGQSQLGPVWGAVTRFLGPDHKDLDPFPGEGTPNFLANGDYLDDFKQVRDSGSAARGSRTAEQQRIGVYWGYDGANNLGVPPRLYNQVARRILQQHPSAPSDTPALAEIFAMINVAMADAGIDAWHYKYVHKLWRPVVGVRAEGPPEFDCFWAPLGAPQTNGPRATLTPNFPAYPSGHATFGAAMLQVLRLELTPAEGPIDLTEVLAFDTAAGPAAGPAVPDEEFEFVSDELDGVASDPDGSVRPRVEKTFKSFAEAVWENAVSRVYLGVHWKFDGIHKDATKRIGGVPLGLDIGEEAHAFFKSLTMAPVHADA